MVDWQSRYTPSYKSKPSLSYLICFRIELGRGDLLPDPTKNRRGKSIWQQEENLQPPLTSDGKLISRTPLGRRDNFLFFVCSRQILYMSSLKRQRTWDEECNFC